MRTILPERIRTWGDAARFLNELIESGEIFHPDDDANDITWVGVEEQPTDDEREHLNLLMQQCRELDGFDPAGHVLHMMELV